MNHKNMKVPKKYWYIAKRLSAAQLQKDSDDDSFLNEKALFDVNIGKRRRNFFLGYYSQEGLELAFEKYSVSKIFKDRGFSDLIYDIDTDDPYLHRLTIYNKKQKPSNMLAELVLKKETILFEMPFEAEVNNKRFDTLAIEWMCLQNPYGKFTRKRPKMPGQKFPGLGLASKAVELLMIAAWRLKLSGLVNTPEHYHNAFLYSKIFYYIDPYDQAKLVAMTRDMKKYSLEVVAWAMEWGLVTDETTGKPAEWFVAKQVIPLNSKLKDVYNSKTYQNLVKQEAKKYKFSLDYRAYKEMKRIKDIEGDDNET